MKKTIIYFVLFFSVAFLTFAQEKPRLSRITINMGEGAFNSGVDITGIFENSSSLIEITGNHQRFYAVYFWKLPLNVKAGICAGAFKNMPQTGPYITFSPVKPLSFFLLARLGSGRTRRSTI